MVKKVSCREAGYECDFAVQSEDVDEVVDFTRQHAKQTHDLDLSRGDAESLVQDG